MLIVMNNIFEEITFKKLSYAGLNVVQICHWYEWIWELAIKSKQWVVPEIAHFTWEEGSPITKYLGDGYPVAKINYPSNECNFHKTSICLSKLMCITLSLK